ncbi:MAG: hypothetical protein ACPL88_04295, partial [Bryobacteraceae bacterium]
MNCRTATACLAGAMACALTLSAQWDKLREKIAELGKKLAVTEIRLRTDPPGARVRPLETLVIQVRTYGQSGEEKVRLRRGDARTKIREPQGGWLSKPFAFQGKDEEKFFEESQSKAWNIFAGATGEFVIKDAFLYTAPESPGRYHIEAELEGKRAEIEIEVTQDAPSRRKPEKVNFPPYPRRDDGYRLLAEHYAPFIAQETWFEPKADFPARFDYDGDWNGDNNWDNLEEGSSQAFVYYAAMETETHWFLIYNVFHPRDYSDRCVVGTCHENDNEGIILTIRKDGTPYGRLEAMETLAHNNVYSLTANPRIRPGAHNIEGGIEFYGETHPAIFIESGGHGIYGTLSPHSRYSLPRDEFLDSTGVTFVYKGTPERPRHASDRLVGYDLLPILDEWWSKAEEGKWDARTFDDYFRYEPFGGRPGLAIRIGGAFYGRKEAANKARPFWGWQDNATLKRRILAVGQWGLDPAYAVSRNLRFPADEPFSLDYLYNPYLGIDRRPPQAKASPLAAVAGQATGWAEIEVEVDGTVDLVIAGETVRFEVQSGQPVARQSFRFGAALPTAPGLSLSVKKLAGRGRVTLLEKPSEENGWSARVRV